MTYQKTLDYLFKRLPMFQRIGAAAYKPDISNTIKLCDILGNPQNLFPSIHIAGTNGKGSTSHLLASVLQEKKLKVGLYTSPHLKDFRERIKINGKKIPQKEVIDFVEKYKTDFEEIELSFFEWTVGLAFDYFAKNKVDIAVIETGMGGRLDSTNILTPILSIITNISYDHTQFLGDTLEKIAGEKAGIIKQNIPVIIGETQIETTSVFEKKANEKTSEILFADKEITILKSEKIQKKEGFQLNIELEYREKKYQLKSPLAGNYQIKNFSTTLVALKNLKGKFKPKYSEIKKGFKNVIKNTGLQGRWQVLGNNPLVICDTGHNEAGISYILEQINSLKFQQLHFVLGMVNDKSIDKILSMLPKNAIYYFCKANIPRGLDPEILKNQAEKFHLKGSIYPSVKKALNASKKNAKNNDLIFIGGSTFTVAEVL